MTEFRPLAWLLTDGTIISDDLYNLKKIKKDGNIPLFTQRTWVNLDDDEMLMIYCQNHEGKKYNLGRMVQQALKEKNT